MSGVLSIDSIKIGWIEWLLAYQAETISPADEKLPLRAVSVQIDMQNLKIKFLQPTTDYTGVLNPVSGEEYAQTEFNPQIIYP